MKTHVVRPGGVMGGDGSALIECVLPVVSVRKLAAAMVDMAVNGGDEQLVPNKVILERGTELLKQSG